MSDLRYDVEIAELQAKRIRAAKGYPNNMGSVDNKIGKNHEPVNYDFNHNIKNLKCLQMILEKSGYPYSTIKTVQDTIKYLEEKEKESK